MNLETFPVVSLENASVLVDVDPLGGAISGLRLTGNDVNVLGFRFSKEQMPVNNKAGANYQGHFACIGRWGAPSDGEMAAGLPHHGEPANIQWMIDKTTHLELEMQTTTAKEGLHVNRSIVLDEHQPVFLVAETITNVSALGRLVNIVQHPTLSAPFLDEFTLIDCNATKGFDQEYYKNIGDHIIEWPYGIDHLGNSINLRKSGSGYNAVFSFVVNATDEYGWITAWSPTHQLMLGYVWKRADFPWIHIWQHFNDGMIQYLGLEFGTAGIHQPFSEILSTATTLFGEKTFAYLDAGVSITKQYFSFMHATNKDFSGVENVYFANDELIIRAKPGGFDINIKLTQRTASELPG